jgi:tungstate transport system substrate-binding protein
MVVYKLILLAILISLNCFGQTTQDPQTISTELRPTHPNALYGPQDAPLALVLGNGGAGPTCLLQELSEDFIRTHALHIQIGWIQTITRLTLENLKEKVIDISLTYEEGPENQALQEGWATERTLVFNDHFILVGPKDNPASIQPSDTIEETFYKIARTGCGFFSRDDLSGANERERMIWNEIQLLPWKQKSEWYVAQKVFPADALRKSDQEGLYTLTDRGTLIFSQDELHHTAVYIQQGENMMNRCNVMLQNQPSEIAKLFLAYLKSDHAQNIILHYAGKKDCIECCPLFTPASQDGFLDTECLEKLGFAAGLSFIPSTYPSGS